MLPSINAHQRLEVAGDRVLAHASDEAQGARGLVLDQPSPAGALDASEGGVGLLLEVVERAKVFLDGSLDRQCMQRTLQEATRRTSSLPSGAPPPPLPLGAKFSQKSEWFK